jgi:hypothetical protein
MATQTKRRRRHQWTDAERQAQQEARAERLTQLHAELAAGVEQLVEGEAWKAMLAAAARFHSYSWRNCLLILSQLPTATHVAGYRTWQSVGRQVRKGERGIGVIAPVVYRGSDEDEDDHDGEGGKACVHGWKIEHVFDISQTNGEPLPHVHPTLLDGEGPSGVWQALADQVTADGFQLLREAPDVRGALGSMNPKTQTVRVLPGLAEAQACKTLAHERAHMVLGHGSDSCTDPRSRVEVEAESVAFVVLAALGLDTSGYSLPYIAGWAADGKELAAVVQTADRVIGAARQILATIESSQTAG